MSIGLPAKGKIVIVLLVSLFVLALVALVVLPVNTSTDALNLQSEERVKAASLTTADDVERRLDYLTALVAKNAKELQAPVASGFDESTSKLVAKTLSDMQSSNSDISYTSLLDARGTVVLTSSAGSNSAGSSRADRPFYQAALRTSGVALSGVLFARTPAEPHVVVASQAIYRPETTEVLAVLTASIDVSKAFQTFVNEMEASSGISLSIYDAHGAVVARPGLGNEMITSTNSRIVGKDRGVEWTGSETVSSEPSISSYHPISNYRWTVRSSIQQNDVFTPVTSMRTQVVVIALILVAALLGVAWLLYRVFSDRAAARRSLTQTEERMREVIESAEQMFVEVDQTGRITAWNRMAEETLGWKRDETLGRTVLELPGFIPETQRETVERRFEHLAATKDGESWRQRIESVVAHKQTGELVHVEISMWTTRVGGELHLAALLQDITARKRFEAEREQLVKQQNRLVSELRRTDESKSDFVSTVSHELRTPLTSIVGYLEMMREGFGGDLSQQQSSMLDVVDRNSRRLLSLIEDLLTLSRIEAGTFRVEPTDVDVASLVSGVIQAMIPSANESSLSIEADVASDTGAIFGDASQLERVLLNLMSNAIKFTPEGGRVSINAFRDGDKVHIAVSDTGIGIAVEEQSRLFTRFFRSPDAQARAIQGTGLGLTIVKSIIERHGGEVMLQSAHGAGTTVNITLPATRLSELTYH